MLEKLLVPFKYQSYEKPCHLTVCIDSASPSVPAVQSGEKGGVAMSLARQKCFLPEMVTDRIKVVYEKSCCPVNS